MSWGEVGLIEAGRGGLGGAGEVGLGEVRRGEVGLGEVGRGEVGQGGDMCIVTQRRGTATEDIKSGGHFEVAC